VLEGLKVVELGELVAAPYAARLLADLGAEVVKVEPPGGDPARRLGPFPGDVQHAERSGLFLAMNLNKRGVTLDVGTARGRELFLRLVAWADVVVENLGPGRIDKLGLSFERLAEANRAAVVTSISPFGQSGPYRDRRATDLVSFHMSGYGYHLGGPVEDPAAEPPLKAAGRQADFVAGVNGALATLAALFARAASGLGQRVDVSTQEALMPFAFGEIARWVYEGRAPSRRAAENPPTGVVAVLPCADGHVAISPREEHLWARWVEVMGNPDWAGQARFRDRASRAAHWAQLEPLLAAWTRGRTTDEVFRAAQAVRVPAFPVNTLEIVFAWPQLAARGFLAEVAHPEAGALPYPTVPYPVPEGGWRPRPAPRLGEHNQEVLCGWLGCSPDELDQLRRAGTA
jgi:crotonobetainyl-CoA:carnitine CoA-transferase CaiB-like acyl-CoA transferase